MKSLLFLLNNSKTYLSFIKFYNKNKKTCPVKSSTNDDANLRQFTKIKYNKKKRSGRGPKCENHQSDCLQCNSNNIDNSGCSPKETIATNREKIIARQNNNDVRQDKLIYVFYADDCKNCLSNFPENLQELNLVKSESFVNTLRPKLVNVEDSFQFGSYLRQLCKADRQRQSLGSFDPLLLCILISAKMVNLIEDEQVKLLCSPHDDTINNNSIDSAKPTQPLVFVLYDELNEINMFRVKYKLSRNCSFYNIQTDQLNLMKDVRLFAISTLNEALYRQSPVSGSVDNVRATELQVSCRPQLMVAQSGEYPVASSSSQYNKSKSASFKLFPAKIKQGNGKVLVLFDHMINYDQQIDVLFNGRSTCRWLKVKRHNHFTLQFIVPDDNFKVDSILNITIIIDCSHCLGTRPVKCQPMQLETTLNSKNIFSGLNSIDFLLQSFGAQSLNHLDVKMATIFDQTSTDFGIFKYMTQSCQIDLWLPTWIHFAAAYGLKELLLNLIKSPAAVRACFVRNSEGMMPYEIATMFGHQEIATILCCYTGQIQNIRQHLIEYANNNVQCLPLNQNNCQIEELRPQSLPARQLLSNGGHYYYHFSATSMSPIKPDEYIEPNYAITDCVAQKSLPPSQPLESSQNDQLILAKNELLDLIDEFKSGISIKLFEQLFLNWENKYQLVLEGNISDEFLHSLNEIRKLCQFDEGDNEVGDSNNTDDGDYENGKEDGLLENVSDCTGMDNYYNYCNNHCTEELYCRPFHHTTRRFSRDNSDKCQPLPQP